MENSNERICVSRFRAACVAIVAAVATMAASGHAATQNIYTWDGGAGTSNWFDAANWSGDAIPGSTQDVPGNVIDQAQIGNVSGTITYTPGTPTTFDYLNITGTTAALTFNINGNLTTTHVNSGTGGVTAPVWFGNPDALGGAVVASPGLLVNVNSGATYTVQQQGIDLMAREFNIASGGTVQSAWNRSNVRALGILSGTMNVQGTFTAMPGWQVPGTFGTGTTFATRGSGGVVLARGGSPTVNVDGGTLSVANVAWGSGGASLSGTSTVNITNNGSVAIQFGGSLDMSGNT
jgi:hypothetical protein